MNKKLLLAFKRPADIPVIILFHLCGIEDQLPCRCHVSSLITEYICHFTCNPVNDCTIHIFFVHCIVSMENVSIKQRMVFSYAAILNIVKQHCKIRFRDAELLHHSCLYLLCCFFAADLHNRINIVFVFDDKGVLVQTWRANVASGVNKNRELIAILRFNDIFSIKYRVKGRNHRLLTNLTWNDPELILFIPMNLWINAIRCICIPTKDFCHGAD